MAGFSDIMSTLNKYLINSNDSVKDSTRLNQLESERKRLRNEYNATSDETKKADIATKLDDVNESIRTTNDAVNAKQERAASLMNSLQTNKAPDKSSAYLNAQAELNDKAAGEEQIQKEQNSAIANQDYRQEADKNELAQSANMQMQARNALGAEAGEGAGALAAKDKIAAPDYNTMMQRSDTRRDVAEQNMQNEYAERQIGLQNRADAAAKDYQAGQMNAYNRTAYQLSTDGTTGTENQQTEEAPPAKEEAPSTQQTEETPSAKETVAGGATTSDTSTTQENKAVPIPLEMLMRRAPSDQTVATGGTPDQLQHLRDKVSAAMSKSGGTPSPSSLYIDTSDGRLVNLTQVPSSAGYSSPWVDPIKGNIFVTDKTGRRIPVKTKDGQEISDGNMKNIVKGLYWRF